MGALRSVFAVGLVAGCAAEPTVSLRGTVYASPDPASQVLPDAALRFVDFEGQPLGRTRTDAGGEFRIDLPAGVSLFVEIAADGYGTATFPGVLGLGSPQQVEHRALYGASLDQLDAWRTQFAGCPAADDPEGALVIGELWLYGFTDPLTGGQPSISAGEASVYVQGEPIPACYLDEEGTAYDPEAQYTGAAATFAVFGVPPGIHELVVSIDLPGDEDPTEIYPVWVPGPGAVVSPWYPAQIDLL